MGIWQQSRISFLKKGLWDTHRDRNMLPAKGPKKSFFFIDKALCFGYSWNYILGDAVGKIAFQLADVFCSL
jgi:hypothetical protein